MPAHYSDPVLTCDGCGVTRERPLTRGVGLEGYKAASRTLHESGWRVVSNPYERPSRLLPRTALVSCADCPPVEPGDPQGVYRAAGSEAARSRFSTDLVTAADGGDA
jgi:hypothetical protein